MMDNIIPAIHKKGVHRKSILENKFIILIIDQLKSKKDKNSNPKKPKYIEKGPMKTTEKTLLIIPAIFFPIINPPPFLFIIACFLRNVK